MGCKNCNGTVSQNNQLPLGCDSILSITNETVGEEIIVTITFCSGAIQQFSIPLPSNGATGADGQAGADGSPGVNITDVNSSVEDNIVTLEFIFSDGTIIIETFAIETQEAQAYVIDHVGLDVPNEDNIQPILVTNGTSETVARSLIPANSWPTTEDTIYFDILVNLKYSDRLGIAKTGQSMFKNFGLELNTSTTPANEGLGISLQNQGQADILFPTTTIAVTGEITRRAIEDSQGGLGTTFALDIVAKMSPYQRGSDYPIADSGTVAKAVGATRGENLAWAVKNTNVDLNVDNYLKLTALPSNYSVDTTDYQVESMQIYFTTRYLKRK